MKNLFKVFTVSAISLVISMPVMAAKIKCWRNSEGVRECGSHVPPEYSQKKVEERNKSGRVVKVEQRAKTKEELAEIERLAKLKAIEDAKIAEQKKQDSILLKTFSKERDIILLRDSKLNVIEGIITVINGNNKALQHKLEKLQKKAGNFERRGKKPPQTVVDDIKMIEDRMAKNTKRIDQKRAEQKVISDKFAADLKRFRELKGKSSQATKAASK